MQSPVCGAGWEHYLRKHNLSEICNYHLSFLQCVPNTAINSVSYFYICKCSSFALHIIPIVFIHDGHIALVISNLNNP